MLWTPFSHVNVGKYTRQLVARTRYSGRGAPPVADTRRHQPDVQCRRGKCFMGITKKCGNWGSLISQRVDNFNLFFLDGEMR